MASEPEPPGTPDNWMGRRVRELRRLHGLSAKELAARAGVTPAYVSRLETGKLSPTVATLTRLLGGMEESVERLFGSGGSPDPVVRRADRRVVSSRGVDDALITAPGARRLRVLETTIAPGAGSGPEDYEHPGDEECVLVLEGRLRVWTDGRAHDLESGDSITFPCDRPHRWVNTADTTTKALWIVTPGGSAAPRLAGRGRSAET